uniref:Kinesin motor domain-containing protein n=1 Tax=Heterorhabditis bacteriophora TaxID=37862 RepID=A0A1I7XQ99_HETBA
MNIESSRSHVIVRVVVTGKNNITDSITIDGDSKTLVIVHLSPETAHINESISSMNFAEKIGRIRNKGGSLRRDSVVRKSIGRKSLSGMDSFSPRK